MLERAAAPAVDGSGDEVSTNEVKRRLPATDPDPIADAHRLEQIVIAHGKLVVLFHVGDEVDATEVGAM
jgi:hypothetical protein